MFSLTILLITVYVLAKLSERSIDKNNLYKKSQPNLFGVFLIILVLVLFMGLSIGLNDAYTYKRNFATRIPVYFDSNFFSDVALGENPGFFSYQVLLKRYISSDPQVFYAISILIMVTLFMLFYRKYSDNFSLCVFLYITSDIYLFGTAAIKQMLAMSIGLWAVYFYFQAKNIRYMLLLLLAATIHPYVLMFFIIPLFKKNVWSKRIFIIFVGAIIVNFIFKDAINFFIYITSSIGEEYSITYFTDTKGVNIFRILVFAVTPLLSYIYRERIRNTKSAIVNISVNMSVISFLFILLGLSGGAVMFSRVAIYFLPFTVLALTWIISNCVNIKLRRITMYACIICYYVFFYYQYGLVKLFVYKLATFQ